MSFDSDGELFIIFDSNVLRNNDKDLESFDEFELGIGDEAQKFIIDNDLSEKVHILLPRIVLLELTRSKNRKLNRWISTIRDYSYKFSGFSDFLHKLDIINCDDHITKIKDKKIVDYEIIEIPSNHSELFKKILERSINKKPPFTDDESDRGFKDTILFMSLLEYVSNNYKDSNSTFVLFSNDTSFLDTDKSKNKTELQKEFALTGNNLEIRNNKDVIGFIKDKFKFDLELANYIQSGILAGLEEDLSNYRYIMIDGHKCRILDCYLSNKTYQQQEGNSIRITAIFMVLHSTDMNPDTDEDGVPFIEDLTKEIVLDKTTRKIINETGFNYELFKDDE